MREFMRVVGVLSRMVKIEHSVFALPFAFAGMFLAAEGWPGWRTFLLVSAAMVAVRSFAMAVNRVADLKYDRENPRTQDRPLVKGEIGVGATLAFIVVCGVVFVAACAGMNAMCLALSPVALVLAGGYSYTKRFTWLCHYWLGSVLGLAPVAGWLAVTGAISLASVLLGLGVTFWVAGFDILYACQDAGFDREKGLFSIPAVFGVPTALTLSSFSHVNTAFLFLLAGWAAGAGLAYFVVLAVIGLVLVWEHTLIKPDDLSRVNMAFFTLNGVIAVFVLVGVLADLWL